MHTTKVFKSGHSQAVRIPKEFQFKTDVVEIFKHGDEIVIREIPKNLSGAFKLLTQFPNDFFATERVDLPPQQREDF